MIEYLDSREAENGTVWHMKYFVIDCPKLQYVSSLAMKSSSTTPPYPKQERCYFSKSNDNPEAKNTTNSSHETQRFIINSPTTTA